MLIKVDIRVPVGRPILALANFARRCEDAGMNGAGFHDHHHTGRDAYLALAAAALGTDRLMLYPATSNVVTRHPLVLAALAQSVAELAPGRVMLTLAPGFRSVEEAGERHATMARLREAISAVRGLLAGRPAELDGARLRLDNVPPNPVRVLLTASGPRLLELAGEVADGALMLVGLDRRAVDAAREHLRAGAERAGRDPSQLQEVFVVPLALGEPDEVAEWPRRYFRPGRPWLAYPSNTRLHWLRLAGVPLPADPRPEDVSAAQARGICDALRLFGPAEYCADRLLRAREEAGIGPVFLFPEHTAETSTAFQKPKSTPSAASSPRALRLMALDRTAPAVAHARVEHGCPHSSRIATCRQVHGARLDDHPARSHPGGQIPRMVKDRLGDAKKG